MDCTEGKIKVCTLLRDKYKLEKQYDCTKGRKKRVSVYGELQLEWVRLVRERIDKRPLASLSAHHFIFSRNRSLKNWSAPIHSFSLSFFPFDAVSKRD